MTLAAPITPKAVYLRSMMLVAGTKISEAAAVGRAFSTEVNIAQIIAHFDQQFLNSALRFCMKAAIPSF